MVPEEWESPCRSERAGVWERQNRTVKMTGMENESFFRWIWNNRFAARARACTPVFWLGRKAESVCVLAGPVLCVLVCVRVSVCVMPWETAAFSPWRGVADRREVRSHFRSAQQHCARHIGSAVPRPYDGEINLSHLAAALPTVLLTTMMMVMKMDDRNLAVSSDQEDEPEVTSCLHTRTDTEGDAEQSQTNWGCHAVQPKSSRAHHLNVLQRILQLQHPTMYDTHF